MYIYIYIYTQFEGLKSQSHCLNHLKIPFESSNLPGAGPIVIFPHIAVSTTGRMRIDYRVSISLSNNDNTK